MDRPFLSPALRGFSKRPFAAASTVALSSLNHVMSSISDLSFIHPLAHANTAIRTRHLEPAAAMCATLWYSLDISRSAKKARWGRFFPPSLLTNLCSLGVLVCGTGSLTAQSADNKPYSAQDYVNAFRRGDHPGTPKSGKLMTGILDPGSVSWFTNELESSDEARRTEIVELLVDIDRHLDPLIAQDVTVLRNPSILGLLVGPALVKADAARDSAMAALRLWAPGADLKVHAEHFCDVTLASPSPEGFLLLAKAKPDNCRPALETLARSPEWRDEFFTKVLLAALGDSASEDRFLAFATNAEIRSDAQALSRALENLALIGTVKSLSAVAERLRTPLRRVHVDGFEQSVRLDALRGLSYNYPEKAELSSNYIGIDSRYPYAEAFCTKQFGVRY